MGNNDEKPEARMTTRGTARSALAKCCLNSATMLVVADQGEIRDKESRARILTANRGQAELLTHAADIADELLAALQWIAEIADKNYEQDDKLRALGARTLARISDRARAAIAKAEGRS